jgi:hypothetical protein
MFGVANPFHTETDFPNLLRGVFDFSSENVKFLMTVYVSIPNESYKEKQSSVCAQTSSTL